MMKTKIMIDMNKKSLAVGLVLTFLFGGLGLFYVSVAGGIIMFILEAIAWIITVFTFGFGIIFLIPLHIISVLWCVMAITQHNNNLLKCLDIRVPDGSVNLEEEQKSISLEKAQEVYENGCCPGCGESRNDKDGRCPECQENFFDYAQKEYQKNK